MTGMKGFLNLTTSFLGVLAKLYLTNPLGTGLEIVVCADDVLGWDSGSFSCCSLGFDEF